MLTYSARVELSSMGSLARRVWVRVLAHGGVVHNVLRFVLACLSLPPHSPLSDGESPSLGAEVDTDICLEDPIIEYLALTLWRVMDDSRGVWEGPAVVRDREVMVGKGVKMAHSIPILILTCIGSHSRRMSK